MNNDEELVEDVLGGVAPAYLGITVYGKHVEFDAGFHQRLATLVRADDLEVLILRLRLEGVVTRLCSGVLNPHSRLKELLEQAIYELLGRHVVLPAAYPPNQQPYQ